MKRLAWALLGCSLCGVAVPSKAQAPSPEVARYQSYTMTQQLDDRCVEMSFAERTIVNDLAVSAMLAMPEVKALEGLETIAYFERLQEIVAPIEEASVQATANIECSQAQQILGEAKLQNAAYLIAHAQAGREEFVAAASPQHIQLIQALLDLLRQALSGQSEGTLERLVASHMDGLSDDPAGAARRAIDLLDLFRMVQATMQNGQDLRWNANEEAWMLYDVRRGQFDIRRAFAEPRLTHRIEVAREPDSEVFLDRREYKIGEELVVLPVKDGDRLQLVVLPASPMTQMQDSEATIAGGDGQTGLLSVNYASATAKPNPRDCPEFAQCYAFNASDTGIFSKMYKDRRLGAEGLLAMIHQPRGPGNEDGLQKIRDNTGPEKPVPLRLPEREIFE